MKTTNYLAGIACAALMASASPASAATLFKGSIDHVDLHNAGDGLLVYANPLANSTFDFTLDAGNPTKTISNFLQIGTTEGSVELFEDTTPKPITVFFNFENPFDSLGGISGSTTGFYTLSLFGSCGAFAGGCGSVNFDPFIFSFGPNNTGSFSLDLSDAIFGTPGDTNVSATFTLLREPSASNPPPTAAVPEPATWAMMILGFGIVGASMRRQQNPTVRCRFA